MNLHRYITYPDRKASLGREKTSPPARCYNYLWLEKFLTVHIITGTPLDGSYHRTSSSSVIFIPSLIHHTWTATVAILNFLQMSTYDILTFGVHFPRLGVRCLVIVDVITRCTFWSNKYGSLQTQDPLTGTPWGSESRGIHTDKAAEAGMTAARWEVEIRGEYTTRMPSDNLEAC